MGSQTVIFRTCPRGHQIELFEKRKRFLVASIGRQYGKSTTIMMRMIDRAFQKVGRYYWVSPIVSQARTQYQRFLEHYSPIVINKNLSFSEATIQNGSVILFKGSDNPDSLRGDSADGVVIDEAATIKENVWPEIIRPMLGTTGGWADFIGTPKGKNWFYNLYVKAQSLEDWSTFTAPSNLSPFFNKEDFEQAQRELPPHIFRQEYLAEFLDANTGEYFNNPKKAPYVTKNHSIGWIDPAYGGHHTAFVIGYKDKKDFHLKGWVWKKSIVDLYTTISGLAQSHNVGSITIESNADKGLSAIDLRKIHPAVQTHHEKVNKHNKIIGHLYKHWGNIYFAEDCQQEFINQIVDYQEKVEPDDGPDAAASLIRKLSVPDMPRVGQQKTIF